MAVFGNRIRLEAFQVLLVETVGRLEHQAGLAVFDGSLAVAARGDGLFTVASHVLLLVRLPQLLLFQDGLVWLYILFYLVNVWIAP